LTPIPIKTATGGVARVNVLPKLPKPNTAASPWMYSPRARVHTFRGAGHTPWMSHKQEYLSVIKEFLDQR
jgi:pimeloyl-ACP methyl ester carboxylesterase